MLHVKRMSSLFASTNETAFCSDASISPSLVYKATYEE